MVCSRSIDDSSTTTKKLIREDWDNVILSALEMIRHGDDTTDNTTVEVDKVVDKILDNAIEAYGSSARDVYKAIFSPALAKWDLIAAVSGREYRALRNTVRGLERADAEHPFSHTIFSMDVCPEKPLGIEVQFKSRWIKLMVLKQLNFLHHLDNAAMIEEMRIMSTSSSFAGFLYEGFAANELAARESSPDLALMKAEEGKTTLFVPIEPDTTASPFNRRRELSYASFSTGPLALELNVPPKKSLGDYFWIPMVSDNPLFDAFVIEFKESAQEIDAIVWILQMTLNKEHGDSSAGYELIKLIKTKVKEAMETLSHTEQRKCRKVNDVIVKYVLVSPEGGRWKLPKESGQSRKGDVCYQCVKLQWYVIARHVCPDN
jgi:hypothetical protein